MTRTLHTMLCAAALALPATAAAQSPAWTPEAGTHPYRYESIQHVPGQADLGFRLDYDLASDGKGGLAAIVRAAWQRNGTDLTPVPVDDGCRAAMGAQPGEIARIRLFPVSTAAAESMGPEFLADCAPPPVFFPMMDILNVALVQLAPQFGAATLRKPGDSYRFAAYQTHADRSAIKIDVSSPGGTNALTALTPTRATLLWTSDPLSVHVLNRKAANGADLVLDGTENFAFEVAVDPRNGVLLGAAATHDQLDVILDIAGVPPIPAKISRDVTIAARQ